ncbi:MAG: DivIVA domain-containing protein [Thermoleophilaceae bacterium]|nr:DivIVA domain-containing protein [Thermoleophilaceae bacterium]
MDDSQPSEITTERFPRSESAADQIRQTTFPVVAMRGYDRRAVDDFLEWVAELVRNLESRQSRETVVQRALEEVGEETAGILQRAHETADEIAARSRAQAEGRIQRAEREADIVRREADRYAEQVIVDTRLLWEERQRLIEDIRHLADEVLATADDAIERVKMPEPLRESDATTDSPTAEVELDVLPGGAGEGGDSETPEESPPPASESTEEAAPGDGGPLPHSRSTAPGSE